jgi:hypothetical protein
MAAIGQLRLKAGFKLRLAVNIDISTLAGKIDWRP